MRTPDPHSQAFYQAIQRQTEAYNQYFPGLLATIRKAYLQRRDAFPSWSYYSTHDPAHRDSLVDLYFEELKKRRYTPGEARQIIEPLSANIWGAILTSAWQVTRGIYRFDPDMLQAVVDTQADKATQIPLSQLQRLPEWTVAIETPGNRCGWSLVPCWGSWYPSPKFRAACF